MNADRPVNEEKDSALSPNRAVPMSASRTATHTSTAPTCNSSGSACHSTCAMGPILGSKDLHHTHTISTCCHSLAVALSNLLADLLSVAAQLCLSVYYNQSTIHLVCEEHSVVYFRRFQHQSRIDKAVESMCCKCKAHAGLAYNGLRRASCRVQ